MTILDYLALGGEADEFFSQFDNSLENLGRVGSSTDIGPGWAHAAATPLRLFKGYVAQSGIQVHGTLKFPRNIGTQPQIMSELTHVVDLMPTFLEVPGARYPRTWKGKELVPLQGQSLIPLAKKGG